KQKMVIRWLSILLLYVGISAMNSALAIQDVLQYVDPFIGTGEGKIPRPGTRGASGNTFPGATAPFGMIQWSPDTASPWYRYSDKTIRGFSLTHFSGAGCPNNEDLPILPFVGPLKTSPGSDWEKYIAD